jgi:hypothetical protein
MYLEDRINDAEVRIKQLEKLVAFLGAEKGMPPMALGTTYFQGSVPSDDVKLESEGKTWVLDGSLYCLTKNDEQLQSPARFNGIKTLNPGSSLFAHGYIGVVDPQLKDRVQPGDIFWLKVEGVR